MAIISLTALDSGATVDFNEQNIVRVSDYVVNGTTEGLVEYLDSVDGFRKQLVIDENETAVAALAAHLIPVTLFANSEQVLICSSKVKHVEAAKSKLDDTTTVGLVRYDAGGATPIEIETVELQAALKTALNTAIVL